MLKATRHQLTQLSFPGMTDRRMPEIVAEGDSLRKVLIERKSSRDRPRNARNLERMCHSRSVMISLRLEKDLRFVL